MRQWLFWWGFRWTWAFDNVVASFSTLSGAHRFVSSCGKYFERL